MPDSADVSHHPFQGEIDELVDAVRHDRETHLNIFDAEKTMAVCLGADQSAMAGGMPVAIATDQGDAMTRFTRRGFLGGTAPPGRSGAAFPARAAAKGTLRLGVASLDAEVLAGSGAGHGKDAKFDEHDVQGRPHPADDPPEVTKACARRSKRRASPSAAAPSRCRTIRRDPEELRVRRPRGFPLIFTSPDPAALDAIEKMAKDDIKTVIHNHGRTNGGLDRRTPTPP